MKCPKCGSEMVCGAPQGPWPVQWECRRCGNIVVPRSKRPNAEQVAGTLQRTLFRCVTWGQLEAAAGFRGRISAHLTPTLQTQWTAVGTSGQRKDAQFLGVFAPVDGYGRPASFMLNH